MKKLIVGIGGPSCSGKSFIARMLLQQNNHFVLIHQDDYYKRQDEIPKTPDGSYEDWDCLEAFDMDKMIQDVTLLKEYNENIIMEGILIFNHPQLLSLIDIKVLLECDYEICSARRKERSYEMINKQGIIELFNDPEGYFDNVVWKRYMEFKESNADEEFFLLGNRDARKTLEEMLKIIKNFHNKHQVL